jgi:hypothetical protein
MPEPATFRPQPESECSRSNRNEPLSGLVLANLSIDFPGMGNRIRPSIHKILSSEGGIGGGAR